MKRFSIVVMTAALACVVASQGAFAHDRESNNGVTMTLHINPDDEPIATQPALLVIEKVETKSVFSWKSCRCSMTISDSNDNVIRSGPVGARTVFTFFRWRGPTRSSTPVVCSRRERGHVQDLVCLPRRSAWLIPRLGKDLEMKKLAVAGLISAFFAIWNAAGIRTCDCQSTARKHADRIDGHVVSPGTK